MSYLESLFSGFGIRSWSFYFPGLGILMAILIVYLFGLGTTTFMGKYFLNKIDSLFHKMPLLGVFYKTAKEALGYSHGGKEFFKEVVLVEDKENGVQEIGFVTNKELRDKDKIGVFIPNSPNPSSGRLVFVEKEKVIKLNKTTRETLKTIVSMGKGKGVL